MKGLVTIGIPVYKRLEYLPNVLKVVAAQDYTNIDLLVSDNGMNGTAVLEIIKKNYPGPFRFRQNPSSLSLSAHFNQIIHEALGDYFLMLADDDEISPTYVSELVKILEQTPHAAVAIAKQEIINEACVRIRQSEDSVPALRSGTDFIRDTWQTHQYKFECFASFLSRTKILKAMGGFPLFRKGTHNDDALMIKLVLNSDIAFSPNCSFRWRVYEASHGWSLSIWDLAADTRQFLHFLTNDPRIREFASAHPAEWKESKNILIRMAWSTYFYRWSTLYRKRLGPAHWIAAAFAIPPIREYYRNVAWTLLAVSRQSVGAQVKELFR